MPLSARSRPGTISCCPWTNVSGRRPSLESRILPASSRRVYSIETFEPASMAAAGGGVTVWACADASPIARSVATESTRALLMRPVYTPARRRSLALERGLPLLEERTHPLRPVLRREGDRPALHLEGQPLGQVEIVALGHRVLDEAERERGLSQELIGERARLGHEARGRHHAVDEADPVGL